MKPRGPLLAVVNAVALCAAIAGCSSARDVQRGQSGGDAAAAPGRGDALEDLLAAAALELRKTSPPGLAVRVVRPFVVASDEPAAVLDRRIGRVVEPAIAWLERTYFRAEPSSAVAIWICADAASYERAARSLTGNPPSTPFGFYSSEHGAIVLDASTGDGTLVHELVHPFVRADFPACPTWLDEGLGSLYERCAFEGGSLRGLVNWRLDALRRAAKEGRVPTISELVRIAPDAFYGEESPLNYAAARYLCLWLQERGALAELYRRLRDGAASSSDPEADAEKALVELLGVQNVADADTAFRAWVTGLGAR
jgi:hypothetical protein